MKIKVTQVKRIPVDQQLTEAEEIAIKAQKYDEMIARRAAGGKKAAANMTAAERSARAKRAVDARIKKLGQNRKEK